MSRRSTALLSSSVQHRRASAELVDSVRAAAKSGGTFEGYANVWDVVDTYGTRFLPGCFSRGGLDSEPYALLWMHDATHVVGSFTAREDDHGLLIAGGFAQTERGQEARELARIGAAPELSVGFSGAIESDDDATAFESVRLVETSLITARMASTPGAALTSVRSASLQLQTPESVRAYVALEGSYEQLQRDVAVALEAWALDEYGERSETNAWYAYVEATFDGSLIAVVERYTPSGGERGYVQLDYARDDGAVVLSNPRSVELQAVIKASESAGSDSSERRARLARARLLLQRV